jgi:AraC family transcriptional regulator
MNTDDAVALQVHNRLTGAPSRLSHGWGVLEAEHLFMPRPKPYDFSLHSGRHYLALLNAHRRDGETTADDLPCSTLKDIRGKLTFVPAGCRLQGWSLPGTTPIAFTAAYLDAEVCSQLDSGETQQLYPMLHFEHPFLAQMMLQLDRVLAQPQKYSRIYVESFAVVLLSEIMHCQAVDLSRSRRAERRLPVKGGLAGWQCKAVCDYIEENLHQDISLAELAAIARLSPYHFCRAFKESVGEPPHRYQMTRRIERARALLADPLLSVGDVAATIGYGSLSRFSALFRQTTGHSPRDYRRKMI